MPTFLANLPPTVLHIHPVVAKFSPLAVLGILGLLLLIVLIGAAIILTIRARLLRNESTPLATGFTLQDLRAMRDRGELTDAEYAAAHAKMVAKLKANTTARAARDNPPPLSPPPTATPQDPLPPD